MSNVRNATWPPSLASEHAAATANGTMPYNASQSSSPSPGTDDSLSSWEDLGNDPLTNVEDAEQASSQISEADSDDCESSTDDHDMASYTEIIDLEYIYDTSEDLDVSSGTEAPPTSPAAAIPRRHKTFASIFELPNDSDESEQSDDPADEADDESTALDRDTDEYRALRDAIREQNPSRRSDRQVDSDISQLQRMLDNARARCPIVQGRIPGG